MTRQRAKAPTQRQLRVGEEVRHVLAEMIERGEMADPELRDVPVTVTEVRMSPDLKVATALVIPLGGGDAERLLKALARAAPYFRARVGRSVRLKFTPKLQFELDTSFDQAARIDALLRSRGRPDGRGEPEGKADEGSPGDD